MRHFIVFLFAALALALAACSAPAPASNASQVVTLDANEFKFEPATVQITTGRPVKVILRNKGSIEHDWSVMKLAVAGKQESGDAHGMSNMAEEPAVHVAAMNGKTGELEFTPTSPGTYEFVCTVAGHKEAGMVGKLVVVNP
ncbi:MAG: cupredoxin domain-containing protein [Chloroflexi bacterium]|nr:cupredoxin domain-containing protein [Chloroflexota bacterium]